MFGRRVTLSLIGVLVLTVAALGARVASSDRIAVAASEIVESGPLRLIRVGARDVTTINVSTTAELLAGLKAAKGGETFLLAPGTYSDIQFKVAPKFDVPVTITSADPSNMAVLTDFKMRYAEGLKFTQLEFATIIQPDRVANDGSYWAYNFRDCANLEFDRVKVHGSLDGDASNDVSGITMAYSKNISITNSEFQQLERAVAFGGGTDGIHLVGNNLHDLRTDGFNFVEVFNVEIRRNFFHDFDPAEGDHPDAIQFWTTHAKRPSTDIVITENLIMKGDGDHIQGIFLRDQVGTLPYERVTISDNLLVGTGYNGIRIQGAKDITITNNNLVTFNGGLKTFLLVQGAEGVTSSGNRAAYVSYEKSSNIQQSGDKSVNPVADEGAAALREWLDIHPAATELRGMLAIDFGIDPLLPPAYFPPPQTTALLGPFDGDPVLLSRDDFDWLGGVSGFLFA